MLRYGLLVEIDMDNYKDVMTQSSIYLAIFAASGGCLIKYFEEYKHARKINWKLLLADLAVSVFLGYFTFWFCIENTDFTLSQNAIATCLVGNFGSRIFNIIRWVLFERIGIPHHLAEEGFKHDSKRNQEQQSGQHSSQPSEQVGRDESRTERS